MNNKFSLVQINRSKEKELYFYHLDHLGSASFITHMDGYPMQHQQYLPYGELFVSQSFKDYGFDSRYKFTAKERDEETGYDYFGARYYDRDLSNWLSVDGMSDKYPSLSPYNYCAWNPVILIDPNGNDMGWYDDENGKTTYDPKINSQKDLKDAGINGTYRGPTISGNMSNGWGIYGDEQGNMIMSMPEIPVDGGKMSEHARLMSNPIVKAIHEGQVAWLPDYVGFSISGNAFVGGGFGGDLTIGYIKGEGLFGNASLREGFGFDISAGISFNFGNYSGPGSPSSEQLSKAGTYQNFGSAISYTSFQDVSKNRQGNLRVGLMWVGGSLNLSLGSKTIWGGSTGSLLTTKPLK